MKYRVCLDLSFDNKADAKSLVALAKKLSSKATNINEGKPEDREIGS